MASLKHIRKRISSVKNTQKVTKAMKLVAAAKLRRAQRAAQASRVSTDALVGIAHRVATRLGATPPALLQLRPIKSVDLIILTSDRGLCGGFNENLVRDVDVWRALRRKEEAGVTTIVVGRKGRDALARKQQEGEVIRIKDPVPEVDPTTLVQHLTEMVRTRFLEGKADACFISYNRFFSAGKQHVVFDRVLPLVKEGTQQVHTVDYLYEPSREEALTMLIEQTIFGIVKQALLDSRASELASRMRAMDNATKNADEMIDLLTLLYNRERQATITADLMDIVGGAEALQ